MKVIEIKHTVNIGYKTTYMFRIMFKLRISIINKVPEIVDCSKLHDFYDETYEEIDDTPLMRVIKCQEAQRIKLHKFIMLKVSEKLRCDANFF